MHSRFYTSTASRSDTHLHLRRPHLPQTAAFASFSFSCLLSLSNNDTQQLGRLQDALTDFLDAAAATVPESTSKRSLHSNKLLEYCRIQWDFINALLCISRRLTAFSSKEQRSESTEIHFSISLRVTNVCFFSWSSASRAI